jgi:hypothetical protein
MTNLVLEVGWWMRLFTTPSGGGEVTLTEQEPFVSRRTGPLSFTNGTSKLYVEWHGNHGSGDIELIDANGGSVMDTLTFHSFHGVVIALGGFQQVPSPNTDPNHGIFLIADDLYKDTTFTNLMRMVGDWTGWRRHRLRPYRISD